MLLALLEGVPVRLRRRRLPLPRSLLLLLCVHKMAAPAAALSRCHCRRRRVVLRPGPLPPLLRLRRCVGLPVRRRRGGRRWRRGRRRYLPRVAVRWPRASLDRGAAVLGGAAIRPCQRLLRGRRALTIGKSNLFRDVERREQMLERLDHCAAVLKQLPSD